VGSPDAGAETCGGSTAFAPSVPRAFDSGTVQAGQTLTGSVTYRNCTSAPVTVQELTITGRPPGGMGSVPLDDFTPVLAATTVAVGEPITLTASRTFTAADPAGRWASYPRYQDVGGAWHDGQEVTFTVTATVGGTILGTRYATGVPYRGINRAGMEYGDDWDGWTGQSYYDMPTPAQTSSELAYFKAKGMNVIRLPISWERVQHALGGPLDPAYVSGMMAYITSATAQGFVVILDLHSYNRYAENAFGSGPQRVMGDGVLTISHLSDVWVRLANLVLDTPNVILNLMNEPHDFPMTADVWFQSVNTVIAAIRATGSTHLILVPNSRGSDVDHWFTYAPNGGSLDSVAALVIEDSANNYAYDMHAYQDSPSDCNSYRDLIAGVTGWAKTNQKKLFLSEMGVNTSAPSANDACALDSLLSYLNSNSDVWLGWTPWDLPPYSVTSDSHTSDGTAMSWYAPFLTANLLGN
jgi:endoglucanase